MRCIHDFLVVKIFFIQNLSSRIRRLLRNSLSMNIVCIRWFVVALSVRFTLIILKRTRILCWLGHLQFSISFCTMGQARKSYDQKARFITIASRRHKRSRSRHSFYGLKCLLWFFFFFDYFFFDYPFCPKINNSEGEIKLYISNALQKFRVI